MILPNTCNVSTLDTPAPAGCLKESKKHLIRNKGDNENAYAYSPYTGGIVRIVRGECAMFGVNNQTCVDELNAAAGVTRAQAAAMYNGAMRGWSTPYAIPANYNDVGMYIGLKAETNYYDE